MTLAATPEPCLKFLRDRRVSLVNTLEQHIESIVDLLIEKGICSRDDQEEILYEKGPRGMVRKVLDILDGKGEEAAQIFISVRSHLRQFAINPVDNMLKQTTEYKKVITKHKAVLKRRSESILFYNTRHGEKIPFSEHYVNLLIVKGHHSLEMKRHEILTFGQQRMSLQQKVMEQKMIKPDQLFCSETGTKLGMKILVTGVAGIGKTVLVQKVISDFSNGKAHQSFDFIIHLTFRDLNLINKPVSLRGLILSKNGHLAAYLDTIAEHNAKLLVILDGFDEFKHFRAFDGDVFISDLNEEGEVVEVLSSLLLGELLPGASVLVTSRPLAVNHMPVGAIDCFVVISGFSTVEICDYFHRFFQDVSVSTKMFDTVVANDLLLTLCYIPAFCQIVCSILKESNCLSIASPKTMTDIYVQYLLSLVKSHMKNRAESLNKSNEIEYQEQLQRILLKLGRLAYQRLINQETVFYSLDDELTNCVMVSTFLDKTSIQDAGCIEDLYSFTHLTVQEFFAALYFAIADVPLSETLGFINECNTESMPGNLDLFTTFLSGLLSERNQALLCRHIGFGRQENKMQSFRQRLVSDVRTMCEKGAYILSHLHRVLEQQDVLLIQELQLQCLRVNLSDVTLSTIDYNAVKYFLSHIEMNILELDLTGTNICAEALRDLKPFLLRVEKLWLGENSLDMEAVMVIAEVVESSNILKDLGLGWTDIGDEELVVLANAIKIKRTVSELWMEGNRISFTGLSSLCALMPSALKNVVAIWNNVSDDEEKLLKSLCPRQSLTLSFTDDLMWKDWARWVLDRCEVSSSEKLVTFLHKVCDISVRNLENLWAQSFYKSLIELIRMRTKQCLDEDVRRKLEKFEATLTS